ncbi:cbb3-type cytochrome c oxidase subunit I [Pseudoduganella umbonata]|uniref:Cytochrome c oxidase subunit I+III n=1 Tax=Pseudoduganella umbonata TaxID=864828 RepID=A0A4P8HNY5_9BURK|nr:cbb3-type cytochrome c oxidase subunit I [Pseudoduganella umbonata]MBB3220161.1 cytochrome c oxidase subunit I+III [Pseudoduganella umbonata]QCP10150.1 cytochrome ubiquinol oxidase subunit I [Pseudoduganella umbonata]
MTQGMEKALPNRLPRPPQELQRLEDVWRTPRGWRLLSSVNNTTIGLLYIGTSLLFFVLAGVLGLLIRLQLAVPENSLFGPGTYNQIFTMHGTVMMFLFAIPVVEAVAVYLLPGMLGARDLPFPRLSAYAYWAYAFGGLGFFCTLFVGLAPDGGWFMYPPLTGKAYSPGLNADFWLLGIGFIEISAIAGAIELIVGILFTRAPGMTLLRMPVYAWAMLVVGVMIVFAFPAVIAGTALLELERAWDWPFFIADRGGDPILWQHLFWFFGHPEVYIIFLPAAGMVSTMIPTIAGTALVGRRAVIVAMVAVGFFSFGLWAHHMFTTGLGHLEAGFASAASMAVAVPTAIQLFAWIGTLWNGTARRGRLAMSPPALFILGFLFIFVLGGLTGVMVAVVPYDWQVHDSYFIVAHFHYVLIGGMVFPLFAALCYWLPLVNGHAVPARVARWSFGLMFGGFNLAFFPMHVTGLLGMPRRVYTYPSGLGWELLNMLSTIGAFVFAAGVALFFGGMVRALMKPEKDPGNPWNAGTLEWLPSEDYATRSIPQVESTDPLWASPDMMREVEQGAHWLPGTVTGKRETIVTTPVTGRLRYLLVLPTDSWLPFLSAAGTAGFFLLLTAKQTMVAWICGVVAIVTLLAWLWEQDQPAPCRDAKVGEDDAGNDVVLPVGATGPASHSWWATIIMLIVDAGVFLSFLFAYVHVSMRLDVCPPPGARLAAPWPAALSFLLVAGGGILVALARRRPLAAGQATLRWLIGAAIVLAAAGFGLELAGQVGSGLSPTSHAWSAAVATLVAYQGLHVLLCAICGAYVIARSLCRHLTPHSRGSLDNTALIFYYTVLQGAVTGVAVHLWPRLMG